MNKQELTSVLQSCIFSFDGSTHQEIMDYNLYDESLISLGEALAIKLKNMRVLQSIN